MEKLFTALITMSILGGLLKIGLFYLNLKVRSSKPLSAEEIIKCRHMNPEAHKKIIKDMIIDHTRDEDVELQYRELRDTFKTKLQCKEITRGELLGIEEYLRVQLNIKKKYNNNAHAIYSMLKSEALSIDHISTIKKFIS